MGADGRLKTKENFKLSVLKWSRSVTVDGCLKKVPNIVIWLGNFWYFGELVAEGRWLPIRELVATGL